MTVKEYVDHRKQFPITRKLLTAGALMASAASTAYLQAQESVEEPVEDDYVAPGMYL